MSDPNDPSANRAENIHASAQSGGTAVGAVQARDIGSLRIGSTYEIEALTLRATPPAPPPHFTGREDDLTKFTQLLTSGQNVAITALHGMGGIGKTALAQKLAERVRDQFPGGVLWWTLGPSADVFTALDVWARHANPNADLTALPRAEDRAEAVRPLLARLGKMCVIIDDVWDEAAARILMSAIPPGCPILITTRDGDLAKSLRCRVERLDALSDDEAVALLEKLLGPLERDSHPERSRAAAQSKDAHPSTPSPPLRAAQSRSESAQGAYGAARDIAHLTEGLPLALELIAGIADSPADLPALAGELRTKPTLDVLKRGTTREQSVEACFTMSYERLDADMQRRFRALGVFAPAPFDRDAIAAVWDEEGDAEHVDEAIKFLLRRSLLSRVIPSEARNLVGSGDTFEEYQQHALLRDYAVKLLSPLPSPPPSEKAPTGEGVLSLPSPVADGGRAGDGGFASRHAAYYRRFVREKDWRSVEHFFDQIDYGWQWVQAHAREDIINYVFAFRDFLKNRGRQTEILTVLKAGLAQTRNAKDRTNEGIFLNDIGRVYDDLGQKSQALSCLQQSLAICRELKNRRYEGTTLNNIGLVYDALGQPDMALDFYQQALAIRREVGDRFGEGTTLGNIGEVHRALGQRDKALDFYQQALAISREVGDRAGEGAILNNIGQALDALGQPDKALDFYQQALAIMREVGDRSSEGTILNNIGGVYDALGQRDKALEFYQQALTIHREVGNRSMEGATLNNIGRVYENVGQMEKALDFYQQAFAIVREVGNRSGEGTSLNNIACVHFALGQAHKALDFFQQALAIHREVGNRSMEGTTLYNFGEVYRALGQMDKALDFLQQALAIHREVGNRSMEGTTLNNIGLVYDALGQKDKALSLYQQALAVAREVGNRYGVGMTLWNMGDLFERMNRLEEAEEVLQQAVVALRDCSSPRADQAQVLLDRVWGKLGKA